MQGDELIATSGITYTTEQQYGETRVKGGEQVIRLLARGEVLARHSFSRLVKVVTMAQRRACAAESRAQGTYVLEDTLLQGHLYEHEQLKLGKRIIGPRMPSLSHIHIVGSQSPFAVVVHSRCFSAAEISVAALHILRVVPCLYKRC